LFLALFLILIAYDPCGKSGYQNCYDVALSLAVDNATRQGAIVIVAAGNCGPEEVHHARLKETKQ
jgi:hypothetical protein